jgi:membrane-associated protease RseP (regulator of RpoE activity)
LRISADELVTIRSAIRKYFAITGEVKVQDGVYEFYTLVDPNLEGDFKKLVFDLKAVGYIPVIGKRKESGSDYVISVIKRRKTQPFGIWLNIVLLVATIASTTWVGEILYSGYFGTGNTVSAYFFGFLYFSLPLLIILTSHELGHYFMAKRNGVAASLPFFIPAPLPPLGTLGALISLRDPLPDRKTLIKIGAAGPLVGFVMSIIIGIIGAYLGTVQKPVVVTNSQVTTLISLPVIYYIFPAIQMSNSVHPVAFAAWVGFLVTAINLFPIGQLDGGHVARGLLGKNAKYLSYAFIVILVVLGIYYVSWILFAIIIIVLGLSHPPPLNDISKPGKKEIVVGIVAIALVAICFSPVPFAEHVAPNIATSDLSAGNNFVVYGNPTFNFDSMVLTVDNLNNYTIPLSVSTKSPTGFYSTPSFNETMAPLEKSSFRISVSPYNGTPLGQYSFTVNVKTTANTKPTSYVRNITLVALDTNLTADNRNPYYSDQTVNRLTLSNIGPTAYLQIYKFNDSSNFYINGTTAFVTSGTGTYLEIPKKSEVSVTVVFFNLTQPAGIVLEDKYAPYHVVVLFYIPPDSPQYNFLY